MGSMESLSAAYRQPSVSLFGTLIPLAVTATASCGFGPGFLLTDSRNLVRPECNIIDFKSIWKSHGPARLTVLLMTDPAPAQPACRFRIDQESIDWYSRSGRSVSRPRIAPPPA